MVDKTTISDNFPGSIQDCTVGYYAHTCHTVH
jgi:hypothetical protein